MSESGAAVPQGPEQRRPARRSRRRRTTLISAIIQNFAIITTTLTLLGSAIAFFIQRSDQRQNDKVAHSQEQQRLTIVADTSQRESKKSFLDLQLKTYSDALITVETLATTDSVSKPEEYQNLSTKFQHLYLGEMSLVEDKDVETVMVIAFNAITGNTSACRSQLRNITLSLSHCMRKSLSIGWGFINSNNEYCTPQVIGRLSEACGLHNGPGPEKK